jgi:hypothetical protein
VNGLSVVDAAWLIGVAAMVSGIATAWITSRLRSEERDLYLVAWISTHQRLVSYGLAQPLRDEVLESYRLAAARVDARAVTGLQAAAERRPRQRSHPDVPFDQDLA